METPNLDKARKEVAEELVAKFRKAAKDDDFNASGRLDRSFGYEIVANEIKVFAEKYAGALSDGISDKGKYGKDMAQNLAEWAKSKGMQPLMRDKKGRFKKVTENSYKSLGFVLARSIAKKGISKRFNYNGSGFIQRVVIEQKDKVKQIFAEAFKKDAINELKNKYTIK